MSDGKVIGSDISGIYVSKFATGIARVIVETHRNLAQLSSDYNFDLRGLNFRSDSICTENAYILSDPLMSRSQKTFNSVDLALSLDGSNSLFYSNLLKVKNKPYVISLIHDFLPITYPEFYYPNASTHFRSYLLRASNMSDSIILTSHYVEEELHRIKFKFNGPVHIIPLGAHDTTNHVLVEHHFDVSLIVVATLEPKKGYSELLDAFDILKSKGVNVRLIIVGVYGWNMEKIQQRILNHPSFGKELFWYSNGISDQELDKLYAQSDIAIVPSYVEGFGLAIEEGLAKGLIVIARNIPVFKERSQPNLYFFETTGMDLALVIIKQLDVAIAKVSRKPSKIRSMNDFTLDLFGLIKTKLLSN